MNRVIPSPYFNKLLKRLLKKFPSLNNELTELEFELIENPEKGIHIATYLNNKFFKIRLASKSKGGGKSGGFRIVTYVVKENKDSSTINLIMIFDKSEESNVLKSRLIAMVKAILP